MCVLGGEQYETLQLQRGGGGGTSVLREGVRVIDGRGSVPPRGVRGHAPPESFLIYIL